MIEIHCDYHHPQGRHCEDGQVLIYGMQGGPLPETITCPNCKGTRKYKKSVAEIRKEVKELEQERKDITAEIYRWKRLLLRNGCKP